MPTDNLNELAVAKGAWAQFLQTGDECYLANMKPDEMRELLRWHLAPLEHQIQDISKFVQIIKDLCGWSEEDQTFYPGVQDEQGGCNFCGGGDWHPDTPYTFKGQHYPHAHFSDCAYLRAREAIGLPLTPRGE